MTKPVALLEGTVTLKDEYGYERKFSSQLAGIKSGYGFIGNPHFYGDPDWRFKDGDTVMSCGPFHPQAMPVLEAYQELDLRWEEERDSWYDIYDEWDREYEERQSEKYAYLEWEEREGRLYDIQEELSGIYITLKNWTPEFLEVR